MPTAQLCYFVRSNLTPWQAVFAPDAHVFFMFDVAYMCVLIIFVPSIDKRISRFLIRAEAVGTQRPR